MDGWIPTELWYGNSSWAKVPSESTGARYLDMLGEVLEVSSLLALATCRRRALLLFSPQKNMPPNSRLANLGASSFRKTATPCRRAPCTPTQPEPSQAGDCVFRDLQL